MARRASVSERKYAKPFIASASTNAMTSPVRPNSDPASSTNADRPPSSSAVLSPFTILLPSTTGGTSDHARVFRLPTPQVDRPGVQNVFAAHDVQALVQRDGGVDVRGHHAHPVPDPQRLARREREVLVGDEPHLAVHRRVAVVHPERLEPDVRDRPA